MSDIKFHGIIGDMNPIEHGGGVVFDRGHGPEMLYFQDWAGEEGPRVSVYEFTIAENVIEELTWVEWESVASCIGMDVKELKEHAVSENVLARASVYQAVGAHSGFREFDWQPQELTMNQAEVEFGKFVDRAHGDS